MALENTKQNSPSSKNLPPPRISKPMKSVSPPLSSTRLHRLIYILAFLTALLGIFYSYRLFQWKSDVGGWWSLVLGTRKPPSQPSYAGSTGGSSSHEGSSKRDSVEEKITALAHALGMPAKELAAAIAVAVREYVPPASLSSVAARETGPAVQAMMKGAEGYDHVKVGGEGEDGKGPSTSAGVVEGVINGMENFVGMDEP